MTPLPTGMLPCNTLAILGVALGDDGGGATNTNANALYKARTQKDQRKELPSAPSLLDPSLPPALPFSHCTPLHSPSSILQISTPLRSL